MACGGSRRAEIRTEHTKGFRFRLREGISLLVFTDEANKRGMPPQMQLFHNMSLANDTEGESGTEQENLQPLG